MAPSHLFLPWQNLDLLSWQHYIYFHIRVNFFILVYHGELNLLLFFCHEKFTFIDMENLAVLPCQILPFIAMAFFKLSDIVHSFSFCNLINDNVARCIPRLHIGMKLSPIKFLDPIHVERIFRKCNVDSGLIVKEVYVVHCSLFS